MDKFRSSGNRGFKKDFGGRSSGGRSFGGGGNRFGRDRDSGRNESFKAVCSECAKECNLPFKPSGDRPVYCSDCFDKKGGARRPEGDRGGFRKGGFDRPRFDKSSFGDKQMHEATCAKCGEMCQVPFRPTGERPVYCSNCFDKTSNTGAGGKTSPDFTEQFKQLGNKLDQILRVLEGNTVKNKPQTAVTVEEVKIEKPSKEATKVKKTTKKVVAKKKK